MSLLSTFKDTNTGSQPSHHYTHHAKEHTQDQIDRPPHTPRRITELLKHGRQQNKEHVGLCHQQERYVNIRVKKLLNPLIKPNSALDFTTLIFSRKSVRVSACVDPEAQRRKHIQETSVGLCDLVRHTRRTITRPTR